MEMLAAIKLAWVILSTLGFIYSLKIFANASSDLEDVQSSPENSSDAVLYQAKLNRRLASFLMVKMGIYVSIGVISIFNTGIPILGTTIVFGLIVGVGFIVWCLYTIDDGRSKLRALVGGRRKEDKLNSITE